MASAIGSALISTILPPMAAKAMEKVNAMVGNNVDGIVNIERDISKLQETLSMIQDIVQVAEEKLSDNVFIRNWLQDVVDIAYESRDVLEDFITFSSCDITAEEASKPVNFISSLMSSCFCGSSSDTSKPPLAILSRLEKDIRSVRERFDEKKEEWRDFVTLRSVVGGGGSEIFHADRRPKVGPSINRDALFLGREEEKEEIMEEILHPSDDRVHVVAICGVGGIGKTTLARSIYNDERVKEHYCPPYNRSWLGVGENMFSAVNVIRKILNDRKTIGIEMLQNKLVKELRGDRFLIVLDDVWDVDDSEWDLLFNPLTEVGKGGLIIITTSRREVCTEINIQKRYDLTILSEQDSWSLFEHCAYINGESDSTQDTRDLNDIGKEIVKKFNGHPLALEVVGRSLLNKDSSTWTAFLESKFRKDDEIMSNLIWNYNHLQRHLKMCFTYWALFPKDHGLDKKALVEMWMAHDLIQKQEQEQPEDVGAHYFEQLVNASLLQCFDGKYKMHDLIHDLAVLVSNGEFATIDDSLLIGQVDKVRHVTITRGDYSEIPRLCKIEKLLTLYTISSDEKYTECRGVLDDVFKQLKSIRVLVLSGEWINEKLVKCISELKHLRYLDVSKTGLKSLPDSLCDLYHLQTLAAPLDAILPRNLVNMVNLRHLRANLSTCKGVGKLTSLQELSSIHVCEGDNIRELGNMQILRGKLRIKGLENVTSPEDAAGAFMVRKTLVDQLELVFDEKSTILAQVLDVLGCPLNLTYLRISGYNGHKPPRWMVDGTSKFYKLQTLELSHCPKLKFLPPLGELTSLKDLSLCKVGVERLGEEFYGKFTDGKVFFPSLESLCFYEMEEWKKWDDINIKNSVSFFPCLTRLEIKVCAKLVSLSNAANFMKSLSSLEISDCRSLVKITSATTIERLRISSCRILKEMDFERLPSLKHLEVSCCNKLSSIPCLVVIRFLKLDECKSLTSLNINIPGLHSLEDLHINGCPTLELAFEHGSSSSSGNSVAVPLQYIRTDNTQVFRTLLHHEFVSLISLSITKLEGFENFEEREANNFCKFRSLRSLCILQCKQLKSLPQDFHKLSCLKTLEINDCPQFQLLPQNFHKLSSLERLYIFSCPQLHSLPADFHKLSSLESLCIEYCPPLQSLPVDGFSPFLRDLTIEGCPLLYERCKNESGLDWHKIKHIRWKRITDLALQTSSPFSISF